MPICLFALATTCQLRIGLDQIRCRLTSCGTTEVLFACLVGSVWLVKGIAIRGVRDEATCCPAESRVLGFDSLASLVTLLHNFYLWLQNIA
jgi:hypothetical protein